MDRTSDVGATWAWGLRRYAWVVALLVVGFGVLVAVAQARSSDVYEARSQVGPTRPLVLKNLDLRGQSGSRKVYEPPAPGGLRIHGVMPDSPLRRS